MSSSIKDEAPLKMVQEKSFLGLTHDRAFGTYTLYLLMTFCVLSLNVKSKDDTSDILHIQTGLGTTCSTGPRLKASFPWLPVIAAKHSQHCLPF